jgi:Ca2+-binding RTX toxin-like protein
MTVSVAEADSATIVRNADAIAVNGTACEAATVATTDSIVVNSTGTPAEVSIDQSGGRFEPGFTTEPDGPEIEFTINLASGTPTLRIIGTTGADAIVIGASGINLNADETTGDPDVTVTGTPASSWSGDGDDALSVARRRWYRRPGAGRRATRTGGRRPSRRRERRERARRRRRHGHCGLRRDRGRGRRRPGGRDRRRGGIGHAGGRQAVGCAVANVLSGGEGDDTIDGRAEADTLLGGNGRDTVSFVSSAAG